MPEGNGDQSTALQLDQLAKAASGALDTVPVILVTNLARALTELGERGFSRVGLAEEGSEALETAKLASARYYDSLPTVGNALGHAIRDPELEQEIAGIMELAGNVLDNESLERIGVAVSLVIPSDALWRGASYYLQSPAYLAATSVDDAPASRPLAPRAPPPTLAARSTLATNA